MRPQTPFLIATALISFAGLGCAVERPPPPWKETDRPAATWLNDSVISTGHKILSGYDSDANNNSLLIGTQVLYAVRTEHGMQKTVRYVLARLVETSLHGVSGIRINPTAPAPTDRKVLDYQDESQESYELEVKPWRGTIDISFGDDEQRTRQAYGVQSESILARMSMYDADGREIGARYAILPEAYLKKGLIDFCEWSSQMSTSQPDARPPTPTEIGLILDAHCALLSFGRVIGSSPILQPIVSVVIPRFSMLLALFSRPRFDLRIGTSSSASPELPGMQKYGPACQVTLDILLNNNPTVASRLVVVRPAGPLKLCAGVAAFEGYRIDRPSRRFSMYLLAARQPAASQPAQ